ncbi:MAG: thiol:disulfide interchange protein DsbA/DsbL [Endozoicomonas sp. (ex Botrylloides leachii)]|nr:thiol:disulfide interchange protein DsbA/DsbL [Endozoicomonas sp. (ex Botrylloides leachii)]
MASFTRYLWLLLFFPFLAHASANQHIANVRSIEQTHSIIQKPVAHYTAGEDYRVLSTPAPVAAGKNQIEVAEVFWYGCPHCYDLEPYINKWRPTLAKDVLFTSVPAFFGSGSSLWKVHAKLYYTLKNMGLLAKTHNAVFDEIQNKKNYLENSDEMATFLNKRFGVNKTKFKNAYNSITIAHELTNASNLISSYGISGVPAIVIDGRYVVQPTNKPLASMINISNYLIEKVRKEREVAKKKN